MVGTKTEPPGISNGTVARKANVTVAGARKDRPVEASTASSFRAGLGLAAVSGCAALAHELLWTRRLVDVLGASAASSTRVFSCYFLGMALGAVAASRLVRRLERPWRAVAWAEAGIALLALPAIFLPQWTGWIWPALGSQALTGWEGPLVKLTISVLVVVPPAFGVGMALPLMACAMLRDQCQAARQGMWLYGVNTLGGVLGLVVICLATLPLLGASGSMWLATGMNVAVAIGCLILDRRSPSRTCELGEAFDGKRPPRHVLWPVIMVAFLSGAGILSFEVLFLQLIALAAPLSFYAPMAVLTTVVLLLGISAIMVPSLVRKRGQMSRVVRFAMLATSISIAGVPLWFVQVTQWVSLEPRSTFLAFLSALVVVALVSLGPAVMLAGLVFPSMLAWQGTYGKDPYGRRWGWLLAANGMGGLLGADLTYRLIVPAMGIHRGIGVVGVAYGLMCLAWTLSWGPRRVGAVFSSIAVTIGAAAITFGPLSWLPQLNSRGIVVLDHWQGREGTVAVVDSPAMGRRIIMSNQYVLGGTKFRYDQARLAHLPLLMHACPRRVVCIGLATGITPGAALEHRRVESLTAVELSPLVVRAADRYFRSFNHHVTCDPRANVVVEDGRTFLAAAPASFDVVVGDLFLPWAPGESRLYSLEHFQSVRAALKPGGIFCQWLAMYQLTPEHYEVIRNTFCQVFPRAFLFRNAFDCRQPAIALVGFRDGDLGWSTIAARCGEVRRSNEVLDPLVRHVEGFAMLYLGSTTRGSGTAVNTLSNVRLELAAGRDRVTGQPGSKYLSGEAWLRFAAEHLTCLRPGRWCDEEQIELAWIGQRLTFWDAVHGHQGPLTEGELLHLRATRDDIRRGFPEAMRTDDEADWSQWPGQAGLVRFDSADAGADPDVR